MKTLSVLIMAAVVAFGCRASAPEDGAMKSASGCCSSEPQACDKGACCPSEAKKCACCLGKETPCACPECGAKCDACACCAGKKCEKKCCEGKPK